MRKPSANDKGTSLTPQEFYKKHVVVSAAETRQLALSTAKQANSEMWHQEQRVRVTATLAKAIAIRCGNDVHCHYTSQTCSSVLSNSSNEVWH